MKTPVVSTLKNRGSTTAKDGRMINAFAEERGGVMRAVKRPAINPAFDNLGAGPGGGLFTPTTPDGDSVIVIVDDVLNTSPGASVRSLAFSVQPDETDINVAITPSVVVHALNSLGQVATGFTGTVVMSLVTNPTGATLGGTTSVAAVAGVATFSNLTLNRSGEAFKLKATSGALRTATSTAFNIPTRLVFTDQPVSTQPNTVMTAVEVTIQDPGGNVDPNYTGNVTLTLFATSGSGVLSGTTTKAAVAGVATFSDLQVSSVGTYDLLAEAESISGCYPPARQFSSSFTIANATHTLVAATFADPGGSPTYTGVGFYTGGLPDPAGSITPSTLNGQTIFFISTYLTHSDPAPLTPPIFAVQINSEQSQDFFTSITINGQTFDTSSALYGAGGGVTQWNWNLSDPFNGTTGTYPVTIT